MIVHGIVMYVMVHVSGVKYSMYMYDYLVCMQWIIEDATLPQQIIKLQTCTNY